MDVRFGEDIGELSLRLSSWSRAISCTLTGLRVTVWAEMGAGTGGLLPGEAEAISLMGETGEWPLVADGMDGGAGNSTGPVSTAAIVGIASKSSAGRLRRGRVNVRESKVLLGHWAISSNLLASDR